MEETQSNTFVMDKHACDVLVANVSRKVETKVRAQLLDLLEIVVSGDKMGPVKRTADSILRGLVSEMWDSARFVKEHEADLVSDGDGPLRVGQVWKHTTGKAMRIIAIGVQTHMWGRTTVAEDLDNGVLMAVENSVEAITNWHLVSK